MTIIELKVATSKRPKLEWREVGFIEDNDDAPYLELTLEDYYGRRYTGFIDLDEDDDFVEMTGEKDGKLYEDRILKDNVLADYYGTVIDAFPDGIDRIEFVKRPDKKDEYYNVKYVFVKNFLRYEDDWKTIDKQEDAFEKWIEEVYNDESTTDQET